LNWNEEVLKYNPLTERDVVHFAAAKPKADAVERYNRAILQIQKSNIDMAAIALKSLAAQYPDFVQAVQLSACCQMIWRDTEAAAAALKKLLRSPLLSASERTRTEAYLQAVLKVEEQRGRRNKVTDALPRFDVANVTFPMLEITGTDEPVEMASRDEIESVKSGKPFGNPANAAKRRKVTYGSTMRQSERLQSRSSRGKKRRMKLESERRKRASREPVDRLVRPVSLQRVAPRPAPFEERTGRKNLIQRAERERQATLYRQERKQARRRTSSASPATRPVTLKISEKKTPVAPPSTSPPADRRPPALRRPPVPARQISPPVRKTERRRSAWGKSIRKQADSTLGVAVAAVVVLILLFVALLVVRQNRNRSLPQESTTRLSDFPSPSEVERESTFVSFTVPSESAAEAESSSESE
jgi:hypothetical protein